MDLDAVRAVCQSCSIIVVEANSPIERGSRDGRERSGYPEGDRDHQFLWQLRSCQDIDSNGAYNHPGIVITASAGDDGYYDFDLLGGAIPSPYNQPNAPASLNTVVAVGGTSLYLGQTATRESETVWNDNGTADSTSRFWGFRSEPQEEVAATCSLPKPGRAM